MADVAEPRLAGEDGTARAADPPRPRRRRVGTPPPGPRVPAADAPASETGLVAEAMPEPGPGAGPAGPAADFRDLLGQAVGIRMDGVSRTFRAGEVEVHALQDATLEIAPGEFVAVIGPSGCGKSTLLGLMGALDRPTRGTVFGAGAALDQLSGAELDDYRLQRVGTVFQQFNLVPTLSAIDNVALPLALAGVGIEERRLRAGRLLSLVGLEAKAGLRPQRLSGGEQQRIAVARALAGRPGLILADEPTGSLDSANGERVLALLEDLHRRGATVVLVTHDPEVARRAERAIHMRDGRVVRQSGTRRAGRAPEALPVPARLSRLDALRLGLRSVGRRPLRTALTGAGVAIGIGVMVLILALASGLNQQVIAPFASRGQLDTLQVDPPPGEAARRPPLDAVAVGHLARLAGVHQAWGRTAVQGTVGLAGQPVDLVATLASLPPRSAGAPAGLELVAGRLPSSDRAGEVVLSAEEVRGLGLTPAQALGRQVAFQALYPGAGPPPAGTPPAAVGVPLALSVVGVSRAGPLGTDLQGGLVPIQLADTYAGQVASANGWTGDRYVGATVRAASIDQVDAVRQRVAAEGWTATTGQDQLRGVEQLLGYLELALVGLAAVALVVACLGIVNTMFSAVLEQTREIGVLKALGARARDVVLLFIAEASVIGLGAGVFGVLAAGLLAGAGNSLIASVAHGRGADLSPRLFLMSPWIAAGGILLAVVLSAASGLLPALRAARLDPVRALRYE